MGDSVRLRRAPYIGRSPPSPLTPRRRDPLPAADRAAARSATIAGVDADQVLAFRLGRSGPGPPRRPRTSRRPRAARPRTSPATRRCSRSPRGSRTSPATATTTRSTAARSSLGHAVRCALHAHHPDDAALYGPALISTVDDELAAEMGGAVPGLLERAGIAADRRARRGHGSDRGRPRGRHGPEQGRSCTTRCGSACSAALLPWCPIVQEPSRRREPLAVRRAAGGHARSTPDRRYLLRRPGPGARRGRGGAPVPALLRAGHAGRLRAVGGDDGAARRTRLGRGRRGARRGSRRRREGLAARGATRPRWRPRPGRRACASCRRAIRTCRSPTGRCSRRTTPCAATSSARSAARASCSATAGSQARGRRSSRAGRSSCTSASSAAWRAPGSRRRPSALAALRGADRRRARPRVNPPRRLCRDGLLDHRVAAR